ncbi:hypothetical protein AVEN_184096-1 [Araneus ventricosus]|uniref:Uncharacterized protein n=1 Tax=Araneus ventricosus TaxID=182803 RepID=A0A4Y2CYD4_ARAVE|nr:hypothetical protein AVEN_184096-1 [Araneus ventricosus]
MHYRNTSHEDNQTRSEYGRYDFILLDGFNECFALDKNEEEWGVFVMNRVREKRSYSSKNEWNHVPGTMNPADLPSRGCSVDTLISQMWHDDPSWLKQDKEIWPISEARVDKEIINSEWKKIIVTLAVTENNEFYYLTNVSSFVIVKITAWIRRFIRNCRNSKTLCSTKYLEVEEMKEAETIIWKMIQKT